MFDTICDLIPRDPDYPTRARALDILRRILNGTLYDVLPYQFHEERSAGGEYIPLRKRRPSVRYALSRVVVEDSVSLLFSEGHFPTIDCADSAVRGFLADVVKETRLNQIMTDAAVKGSVGSVAILMRVLSGRVFYDVLDTTFLPPSWDPQAPDTLSSVIERYKVPGDVLSANGYAIDDPSIDYWFTRTWDTDVETWFIPAPVGGTGDAIADESRTIRHGLGFVPIVWIRNLPGRPHQVTQTMVPVPSVRRLRRRSRLITSSAKRGADSSTAATQRCLSRSRRPPTPRS